MVGVARQSVTDSLEALGVCEFLGWLDSSNGATLSCTVRELRSLISLRPDFIAGIFVDNNEEGEGDLDGGQFREENASRMWRYLDQAPADAHRGTQETPSGATHVSVGYGDVGGFFQVDRHPAFFRDGSTRVRTMMECTSSWCFNNDLQSEARSHGSNVIESPRLFRRQFLLSQAAASVTT